MDICIRYPDEVFFEQLNNVIAERTELLETLTECEERCERLFNLQQFLKRLTTLFPNCVRDHTNRPLILLACVDALTRINHKGSIYDDQSEEDFCRFVITTFITSAINRFQICITHQNIILWSIEKAIYDGEVFSDKTLLKNYGCTVVSAPQNDLQKEAYLGYLIKALVPKTLYSRLGFDNDLHTT